jgi:hypothetical protein
VYLHVTELVTLIDHTAASVLLNFVENFQRSGRGIAEIVGLDRLRGHSHAPSCLRISPPVLARERAEALTELARISLSQVSLEAPDPVAHLERLSLTRVGPIAGQDDHVINEAVARAWRHLARTTRGTLTFVRTWGFDDDIEVDTSAGGLEWLSLSWIERGATRTEAERLSLSRFGDRPRPVTGETLAEEIRLM